MDSNKEASAIKRDVPEDVDHIEGLWDKFLGSDDQLARLQTAVQFCQAGQDDQALPILEQLTDEGHLPAQHTLGAYFANESGIPRDWDKAIALWKDAAQKGYPDSLLTLGNLYRQGHAHVKPDPQQAMFYYRQAADLGIPDAEYELGMMYINEPGADTAHQEDGVRLLLSAAEQGCAAAQHQIGLMYLNGDRVDSNMPLGLEWTMKAVEQDDSAALFTAYRCFLFGLGTEPDAKKSLDMLMRSAELGLPHAQTSLASSYLDGELFPGGRDAVYVPQDIPKAMELYRLAAEQDHPFAIYSLAEIYAQGKYVPQDLPQAAQLYQKAGQLGESRALLALGKLYEAGDGVPQDCVQAALLYQQAIDLDNNAQAKTALGQLYLNGCGVACDNQRAKQLFEQALEQGDHKACLPLCTACVFLNDAKRVWEVLQSELSAGNSEAFFGMGQMYEHGFGVEQNWAQAMDYYQQAVQGGVADAEPYIGQLQEKMAAAQKKKKKGFFGLFG